MRALACVLLVACGATLADDSALVFVSAPARTAGAEVIVGGVARAPALPMTVPVGEAFVIDTPEGPLDVVLDVGDVLLVDGSDVRTEWLVLGDDVEPDRLALRVDGSPWDIADDLGADDFDADGEYVVLEGPDLIWSAADLDVPEVFEALPVGAFARRIGGAAHDFGRAKTFDFDDVEVVGEILDPVFAAGAGVGKALAREGDAPWPLDLTAMRLVEHGIEVADLVEGGGPAVEPGATVVVHYEGWRDDGVSIDSSFARGEPARFPLQHLILGWSEGLVGMRVGGTRLLIIPPEAAYGDTDRPGIPAGSTLVFRVHLLDVAEPTR